MLYGERVSCYERQCPCAPEQAMNVEWLLKHLLTDNVVCLATTWWDYKHHNTVRLLICETSQLVVCFITKACGGRVVDNYIAGLCGFTEKIQSGQTGGLMLLTHLAFYKNLLKYWPSQEGTACQRCREHQRPDRAFDLWNDWLLRGEYSILQGTFQVTV